MSLSCSLTLFPNRDDRPRYVVLVRYELRPCANPEALGKASTGDYVVPVRREYALAGRRWHCIRVTELSWKDIRREGLMPVRPDFDPRNLATRQPSAPGAIA